LPALTFITKFKTDNSSEVYILILMALQRKKNVCILRTGMLLPFRAILSNCYGIP
jgi:hypothetical protein